MRTQAALPPSETARCAAVVLRMLRGEITPAEAQALIAAQTRIAEAA